VTTYANPSCEDCGGKGEYERDLRNAAAMIHCSCTIACNFCARTVDPFAASQRWVAWATFTDGRRYESPRWLCRECAGRVSDRLLALSVTVSGGVREVV
jgi:hypothetical protein